MSRPGSDSFNDETKNRHSDWSLKGIKQQIHSSFDIVLLYKIFSEEQKRLFPTNSIDIQIYFCLGMRSEVNERQADF